MEAVREYLLSVTAAALLCAVACHLIPDSGQSRKLVKLLCGIFLCFTVIRPVAGIELREFDFFTEEIMSRGDAAVEEGEDYADSALRRHIIEQTSAYILDKAKSFGAEPGVLVELSMDDPPVPYAVTMEGAFSPYVKSKLTQIIAAELDIPKERQTWIP